MTDRILATAERAHPRRGFSLIETTASVVLLAAALALTGELVLGVAAHRRSADRRAVALHEASNLLERLSAAGPGDRKAAPPSADGLSEGTRRELPGARVAIEVGPAEGGLERLAIVVTWDDRPGVPAPPVRLTTWVPAAGDVPGEAGQ